MLSMMKLLVVLSILEAVCCIRSPAAMAMPPPRQGTSSSSHEKLTRGEPWTTEGKNIVILCDGTGMKLCEDDNEGNEKYSNVALLGVHATGGEEDQRVYYSPGIGTVNPVNAWEGLSQLIKSWLGLGAGSGLGYDVVKAYRFLIQHYEEGDRIFLFGFSRGAYTVRVLAALVHTVGLLKTDQINLAPEAMAIYNKAVTCNGLFFRDRNKRENVMKSVRMARRFGKLANAREAPIHFLGCWDTVSSVIVPRLSWYWPFFTSSLPYTDNSNKCVVHFRQACAIDERRRMFRLEEWARPATSHPRLDKPDFAKDAKQVWFVGCHGDVGGGWPPEESGLSNIALQWMKDEAIAHGLKVYEGWMQHTAISNPSYNIHDSMKCPWPLLELPPRSSYYREWKPRALRILHIRGLYIPRGLFTNMMNWAIIGFLLSKILVGGASYVLHHFPYANAEEISLKVVGAGIALAGFVWTYQPEKDPSEYKGIPICPISFERIPTCIKYVLWSLLALALAKLKVPCNLKRFHTYLKNHEGSLFHTWRVVAGVLAFWFFVISYAPLAEPRAIPLNDTLHDSVLRRLAQSLTVDERRYRPANLIAHLKKRYDISLSDLNQMDYDELAQRIALLDEKRKREGLVTS